MGDIRYDRPLDAVLSAEDRVAAIRALNDEEVIAALAAAGIRQPGPYVANVLASEAMNRVRQKSTVLETTSEGVYTVDESGSVLYMNPAAEKLLGWTQGELRGQNMHDAVHAGSPGGEHVPAEQCDLLETLRTGQPKSSEGDAFYHKNGTRVPVAYTVSPVVRDGEVEGAVVVFRDISHRQRAERLRRTRHEVTEIIATVPDLDAGAPRLIEAIARGLGWDTGAMWTMEPDAGVLRCAAFWQAPGVDLPHFADASRNAVFPPGGGIPGTVWETGKPFWVTNFVTLDEGVFPRTKAAAADGLQGAVAFPCPIDRRPIAILEFFARRFAHPDEDLLEMVETLGSIIGQFVDRSKAEVRLRQSEARKRGVLDSALDAIVTIDHEGRILDFNPAAESMFGYQAEEVIGGDLYNYIVPERYREAHRQGMARYLATGEAKVLGRLLELPAVRKDGTEFPTEIYIVRVQNSDPPLFTSHMRDITTRKRAEVALRAAEERYRNLFSTMPDALLVVDVDRRIVDANAALTRLTGYALDDLRGKTAAALHVGDEEFRRVGEAIHRHRGKGRFVTETVWRRKDGTTFPIELHASYLTDDAGEVVGLIAAIRDLTHRNQLTKALDRSRTRLQSIYDRLPTMAFRVRARDGVILAANQRAAQELGYRIEELEGLSLQHLYPTEVWPTVEDQLHRALRLKGEIVRIETRKVRKDGRILWVIDDMRADPAEVGDPDVGGPDAEPGGAVLVACEDITPLKIAQGITDAALSRRPLPEMLDGMMRALQSGLSVDTAAVLTYEPEGRDLLVRAAIGIEDEVKRGLRIGMGEGFAGRVAQERKSILLMDPRPEEFVSPVLRERGLRTVLGVPLVADERLVGVLHVGSTRPRGFLPEDVRILELAAGRIASAIESVRLDEATRQAKEDAVREVERLRKELERVSGR